MSKIKPRFLNQSHRLIAGLMAAVLLPASALWLASAQADQPEVKGMIQTLPAGRKGVWKIGGRQLSIDANTRFKEKHCALKVGALAEAEYRQQGQTLIATEIECETELEFEGALQSMPANRIGNWKIADQQIKTDPSTRFEEKNCALKAGAYVEADVVASGQALLARKIECERP